MCKSRQNFAIFRENFQKQTTCADNKTKKLSIKGFFQSEVIATSREIGLAWETRLCEKATMFGSGFCEIKHPEYNSGLVITTYFPKLVYLLEFFFSEINFFLTEPLSTKLEEKRNLRSFKVSSKEWCSYNYFNSFPTTSRHFPKLCWRLLVTRVKETMYTKDQPKLVQQEIPGAARSYSCVRTCVLCVRAQCV